MRFCRTWCAIVVLAAVAGCSRQQTASCVPDARYAGARSALPVQIPDDLSPPNESDAIRLPPDLGDSSAVTAGECLESPPPFFGDSRPFLNGDAAEPSRKERREARRTARNEAPAEAQPGAAQPPPSAPPPSNDDRVIAN